MKTLNGIFAVSCAIIALVLFFMASVDAQKGDLKQSLSKLSLACGNSFLSVVNILGYINL